MPDVITVTNHGPLITATNYWNSSLAKSGRLWCSVNAGAIRVLLPPQHYATLSDMRAARECVLSLSKRDVEIMWDDTSDSPFVLHLTSESFDLIPGRPEPGKEWVCSVWVEKDGTPHKAMERVCHWRRVPWIPWMKPWTGETA